jgi:hypothetical protein
VALECSKPKPGPPVVSISTTHAIPKALGFEHEGGAKTQGERGEVCAMTVGARVAAGACTDALSPSTDATKAGADDRSETDLS